nr:hypothetical protein CFP56_22378 [Quercus suber]
MNFYETLSTDSMPISLPTNMIDQRTPNSNSKFMPYSISSERHSHQLDMAIAPECIHAFAPSCPIETSTGTTEQLYHAITAYSPRAYVSEIGKRNCDVTSPTQKEQHVAAGEVHQHSISTPSFDQGVLMPNIQGALSSTNMSNQPSYHSLVTSEPMCRNISWSTSTSMTDSSDMIKMNSSSSYLADRFFTFDTDMDTLLASRKTNYVDSDGAIFGWNENGYVFSSTLSGCNGLDLSLSGHGLAPDEDVAMVDNEHQYVRSVDQAAYMSDSSEMRRSDSGQSTMSMSSSSTTLSFSRNRDSVRRRKHIENSKQNHIAPKTSSTGTASALPQPHSSRKSEALSTTVSARASKKPISKARYIRRQHPKLLCHRCTDYPLGFRGDHELRRHMYRAHSQRRNVWICTQPSKPSGETWLPVRPLATCKQCRRQKQYNMYYNAAAHLRRAHFCPQKRGRKARGEARSTRPGKTGGDWPPIEWLKANGWLRQIAVDASLPDKDSAATSQVHSATADMLPVLARAGPQPPALRAQFYDTASTRTSTRENSTPLDTNGSDQAVAVAHQRQYFNDQQTDVPIMDPTVGAPASFLLSNLQGLGIGYGGAQYY